MSKYVIDETTLTAIGDAVREKDGSTEGILVSQLAAKIKNIPQGGGGEDLPDEAFVITGNCHYRFAHNGWNWFIDMYGNKITTKDIRNATQMFANSDIENIPFALNFWQGTDYIDCTYLFSTNSKLKTVPVMNNFKPGQFQYIFYSCTALTNVDAILAWDLGRIQTYNYSNCSNLFAYCYSLRSVPEEFLKNIGCSVKTSYSQSHLYSLFENCYCLDEIRGLSPVTGRITSNTLGTTARKCMRLKDLLFMTNEDGTPWVAEWKAQVLDLSVNTGYAPSKQSFYTLNPTDISEDKEVKDDASYQALKNDPDWFATSIDYSRYNHDSAVNTINSLPDTSAYLASAGGTNTIKFAGAAGALTDGGAINTMTEEEIAVAAAKGWTVSFA